MSSQTFAEQMEIFVDIYYFVNRGSPDARISYN